MWQSLEILNVFNTIILKQIFWKPKTFFQKSGVPLFNWKQYFTFLKLWIQFKNLLQIVDLMYQLPKCPYSYFSLALEFYLRVLFPCEYS